MLFPHWIAPLVTLTAMEVVLGIDNIIFLAILVSRLPAAQQGTARVLGLGLALGTRLLLLFVLSWFMGIDKPLFYLADLGVPGEWGQREITLKGLILIGGGLFLIAKSTYEIHEKLEGAGHAPKAVSTRGFAWTLVQIALIDIVFSLDSVVTAVGMAQDLWVMVTAMIIAVGVMLVFAGPISAFVLRHPSIKVLALSFLLLIGVLLVAEGLKTHIERGYIYFAMAFSLVVELLNLRVARQVAPVQLR
jgi:predicted tellurium resistance membrane protein TerC